MLDRSRIYSHCVGDRQVADLGGRDASRVLGQEPAIYSGVLAWAADDDALLLAAGKTDEYADFATS